MFWSYINRLGPRKPKNIPLKVYDNNNTLSDDSNIVLQKWRDDFQGLYNIPDTETDVFDNGFLSEKLHEKNMLETGYHAVDHSDSPTGYGYDYLNIPFSLEELIKVCGKIKNGKSVGPDLLPNEVLTTESVRFVLLKFMNKCFEFSLVPGSWQQAIIAPIPKSSSKDPFVPLNYRGISLSSCFYKMYSSLINNRLSFCCESNDFIVDEQNGFRPGRSCTDHIYCLSSIIRNRNADNLSTYCAFIDMRKAFDWVNRDLLLYKLMSQFEVYGKLYDAIKSIYCNSSACVRVNNNCTDWFNITSGVKQGDVLSPTLFSMYLNDMAVGIKQLQCGVNLNGFELSILLYADDIALIAPDEHKLQLMLEFVSSWCKKWRMVVNTDKTQVVHFRPARKPRTRFEFHFGGDTLLLVPDYKYLGVYLDEHLSFKKTATALSEAASHALGAIRYRLRFLKECMLSTFTTLFSSCVFPILDYGAGVWGIKEFNEIDRVQEKAIRYFLGVHRFAPIHMLYGDIGWIPCHVQHKSSVIRLWNRLTTLSASRVTSKVFHWDLLYSCKQGTWSYCVKKLFSDIDLLYYFDNSIPCSIETASRCFYENYQDIWNIERYGKPKLRYYNIFKSDLLPEEYLNLHIQKYQRSLFAQFRAGILSLHVETGRFRNLPLEQRFCVLCDKSEVEDEYHLLCQCAVYRDLRRKLYSTTIDLYPEFEDMDDLEKFVFLNSNLQKHVIVFITSAVLRRRTLLFHWGGLVLACALVYMYTCVWFVTYKPNGAGWWFLNYMLYLYYDITCHVNRNYVMLCYVMLYLY